MKNQYRFTGCARFALFMVLFVPLSYFGIKYFAKNDERAQNVKEWMDKMIDRVKKSDAADKVFKHKKDDEATDQVPPIEENSTETDFNQELEMLRNELIRQDGVIQEMQKEIDALKSEQTE